MDRNETFSVFLMVALLAFAVILVDERWLRTGMAVLPGLMLAQKALGMGQPAITYDVEAPAGAERRRDDETRGHLDQLLKHFREFYTTCHLLGTNVITPEAAEERAHRIEMELNRLLARITDTRGRAGTPS